jgi:hypothetical protein
MCLETGVVPCGSETWRDRGTGMGGEEIVDLSLSVDVKRACMVRGWAMSLG